MINRFTVVSNLDSSFLTSVRSLFPNVQEADITVKAKAIKLAFTQVSLTETTRSTAKSTVEALWNQLNDTNYFVKLNYNKFSQEEKNHYRMIDNTFLVLGQYFPANKRDKNTNNLICPLANTIISPNDHRFILSNGMHLSFKGIIEKLQFETLSNYSVVLKGSSDENIPITFRDKDRLDLFRLKHTQSTAHYNAGMDGIMIGGALGVSGAIVCAYYGVSLATFLYAPCIAPLIVLGLLGAAGAHYMNAPGKRGKEITEQVGDVVSNMTFQDISNIGGMRGRSSMWKVIKEMGNVPSYFNSSCRSAISSKP